VSLHLLLMFPNRQLLEPAVHDFYREKKLKKKLRKHAQDHEEKLEKLIGNIENWAFVLGSRCSSTIVANFYTAQHRNTSNLTCYEPRCTAKRRVFSADLSRQYSALCPKGRRKAGSGGQFVHSVDPLKLGAGVSNLKTLIPPTPPSPFYF